MSQEQETWHEVENPSTDAFYEGQEFEGSYPPEAAAWCNDDPKNRYAIREVGQGKWKIINWKAARSEEELWSMLRMTRNTLLEATDRYMTEDYPIEPALKAKLKEYRRELRNITRRDGAPWDGGEEETPWPTNPLE